MTETLDVADFDAQLAQEIMNTDATIAGVAEKREGLQEEAKRCTGQLELLKAQRQRYVKALGHDPATPSTDAARDDAAPDA